MAIAEWVFASLVLCQPLPQEFNRERPDGRVNEITEGGVFGIKIGISRAEADAALRRKLRVDRASNYPCRSTATYDYCHAATEVDYYDIPGCLWGGNVTLYSRDGRVIRIVWYKAPFDP